MKLVKLGINFEKYETFAYQYMTILLLSNFNCENEKFQINCYF